MAARADESRVVTIAVPRELASLLRVIAAHRELTMQAAFERYCGPALTREYRKVVTEADADLGGES